MWRRDKAWAGKSSGARKCLGTSIAEVLTEAGIKARALFQNRPRLRQGETHAHQNVDMRNKS